MGDCLLGRDEFVGTTNDDPSTQPLVLDSGGGSDPVSPQVCWLYNTIQLLDNAIEVASRVTLEPKCIPNPKGAQW